MADVCERHRVKLLAYGTLVKFTLLIKLISHAKTTQCTVRRVSCRQVSQCTRTRPIFGYTNAVTAQGTDSDTLIHLRLVLNFSPKYLDMILKAWGACKLFQ